MSCGRIITMVVVDEQLEWETTWRKREREISFFVVVFYWNEFVE